MASGGIVLVFLLMLLLPCAMTLFSERQGDTEDLRADGGCEMDPSQRDVSPRLIPRVMLSYETETKQALSIKPRTPAPRADDLPTIAAKPTYIPEQTNPPVTRRREVARWHETTAPIAATQKHYARIESPVWTDDQQLLAVRRQQRHDEDWRQRKDASMRQARLEMAELDVLRARAIALRAHAESLAAVARVARAKAEAAVEEAVEAEHEARHMGYYLRRAA